MTEGCSEEDKDDKNGEISGTKQGEKDEEQQAGSHDLAALLCM